MAMLRTNFDEKSTVPMRWKGFIPSSNWEREILNEEVIKFRFEYLNDEKFVIEKGDESLLAMAVMAYNQEYGEPEFDEDDVLEGFWNSEYGDQGIDCPDNFTIICMAAAMQKKGRELRKLKKLAEKQKETWYLKEYHNVMNYWKEVMDK